MPEPGAPEVTARPRRLDEDDRRALAEAVGGEAEVRWDEPMARHTTLRVGGPVDAWIAPRTFAALSRLRRVCHERGLVSRAFGAGSNLLVRDGGVRGVAIALRHLNAVHHADADPLKRAGAGASAAPPGGAERAEEAGALEAVGDNVPAGAPVRGRPEAGDGTRDLWVEAGASTGRVLAFATLEQLGGVEFLGGVPGTLGGGLVMNAGTILGELKDVTVRVFSVDAAGNPVVRANAGCGFVYRGSAIPADEVVTHARLRLRARPREAIKADVEALRARRKDREPHGVHNAGSFFKNPPGDFAGRLIEAAGLKGRRVGGAEVSPVHANWLVHAGEASAAHFLELIELVRAEVGGRTGLRLELEVKIVGEEA